MRFTLPGGKTEGLHQEMTPVNSFRMIFNNYFGANLPYLAEESYYSSWPMPMRFVKVTDQARRSSARVHGLVSDPAAIKRSGPGRG